MTAPEQMLGLFGLPGHYEALIVILAILLLFGGRKLPELARGLGKGLRIFKKEIKGVKDDIESEDEEAEQPKLEQKKDQSSQTESPDEKQ